MHKCFFKLFVLSYVFVGCAVKVPVPDVQNVKQLSTLLQFLHPRVTKKEANELSKDIFHKTATLVQTFKLTSPPQFHNFLVNIGLRKKGLCYDWSDALYVHLILQEYRDFEFHLMGAHIGEYWREHNETTAQKSPNKNQTKPL